MILLPFLAMTVRNPRQVLNCAGPTSGNIQPRQKRFSHSVLINNSFVRLRCSHRTLRRLCFDLWNLQGFITSLLTDYDLTGSHFMRCSYFFRLQSEYSYNCEVLTSKLKGLKCLRWHKFLIKRMQACPHCFLKKTQTLNIY